MEMVMEYLMQGWQMVQAGEYMTWGNLGWLLGFVASMLVWMGRRKYLKVIAVLVELVTEIEALRVDPTDIVKPADSKAVGPHSARAVLDTLVSRIAAKMKDKKLNKILHPIVKKAEITCGSQDGCDYYNGCECK